jgi:hypothetical protein
MNPPANLSSADALRFQLEAASFNTLGSKKIFGHI